MDHASPEDSKLFGEVYGLGETEAFRWVPPPFIKQRMVFYQTRHPSQAELIPAGPCVMQISWRNGNPHCDAMTFGRYQVQAMIEYFLNIYPQELEGDASLAKMDIRGDLVLNAIPDFEQSRDMLQKIIGEIAGTSVILTFREVERPAIIFKGKWEARNVDGTTHIAREGLQQVEIYGANLSDPPMGSCNCGTVEKFAKSVGAWIGKAVMIEASEAPQELSWRFRHVKVGTRESARLSRDPDLVCIHIQEQTELSLIKERRLVRRLFIERGT